MTPREINKITIPDFLASIGCYPERKFHGYWMYKTPWNDQRTGSMKVDLKKGLWIDFSCNQGGTLIDLILKLYPELSVKDVVRKFNQGVFSFHQLSIDKKQLPQKSAVNTIQEEPIGNHHDLCSYLSEVRGIDPVIADKYLKAYQYRSCGKLYWNLGAKNHAGGYNLFAKGFKCATKQGYTMYENTTSFSRIYFEGIMDFLSFLMIYPDQEPVHEYCILNTVNNLKKTFENLKMKGVTISFFDNDQAGEKATEALRDEANMRVSVFYDYRKTYSSYKDLNDYLMGEVLSCKL